MSKVEKFPISSVVLDRLNEAKDAADAAQAQYRKDALAHLKGDTDLASLEASESTLALARASVARLEAILSEARSEEAEASAKAQKALEDALDRELIAAMEEATECAAVVQEAAVIYANAFRELVKATEAARGLLQLNPRAPADKALALNPRHATQLELARVSVSDLHPLPGADTSALSSGRAIAAPPISEEYEALAASVAADLPGARQ